MPKPKRLTYRELKKRLKRHGIIELSPSRGSGSERIFYQESTKSFHSVTCHGEGQQIGIGLLKSIVRRFNLPKDFLD